MHGFCPKSPTTLFELVSMKPTPGKSVVDFAARLRKSAEKCNFENWSADKMIKCLVISNMVDEELRLSCLRTDFSLDQVLDKAQLKEDTTAMSRIMGGVDVKLESRKPGSGKSVNTLQERKRTKGGKKKPPGQSSPRQGMQRTKCIRCGRKKHVDQETCPAKGRVCNYCGKKGHYAKLCRTKDVKCVTEEPEEDSEEDDHVFALFSETVNRCDVHNNKSILSVGSECRPKGKTVVMMNGVRVDTMVDTGASVNIIDVKTYE